MNAAYGFVFAAFALFVLLAYLAALRARDLRGVEQAGADLRALDIEAFRNLTDPAEEQFLRSELPLTEFKKIKRERVQAALAYVKVLSNASLQLAQIGGAAQRSEDPAIATSGRQIADSASSLRLQTLKASANLMIAAAFPGFGPRPLESLLDQYDRATQLMQRHNVLQRARSRAA
jgi:hypothetical protein